MVPKKVPFSWRMALSNLRNPSGRVAYGFGFFLLLSFLVFYVFIPIFSGTAPALSSADATTSLLSWFPSFSNGANLGALENNLTASNQMAPTGSSNSTSRVNATGALSSGEVDDDAGKNGTLPQGSGSTTGPSVNSSDHETGSLKECDIFDGRWVRDEREPFYPPGSCPYVDPTFNCHANGRPDYDFLHWRWQPNHCDIPRMNATDFLERLRGRRVVFVGDSLNRNMWESLVCTLRNSVVEKERVFEVSGGTEFKARPYSSFKFKDYNCTVEYARAPFLVKQTSVKVSRRRRARRLRLDIMETTTSGSRGADVMVFNTARWWGHDKTGKKFFQVGNHVYPYLPRLEAYEKGLGTWARWMEKNIDSGRTQVFFRSLSHSHFSGGRWNSGGHCHKETEPIYNDAFLERYHPMMLVVEKTIDKMRTPVTYLNVSRLTSYRKDGHPSIYRRRIERMQEQNTTGLEQDCCHWCLPGVPDTWNELLYASLLKISKGPWKN